MVTSITDLRPVVINKQHAGQIIELVGPAGAGKSTLYTSLGKDFPWIHCTYSPHVWRLTSAPFYLTNLASILPIYLRKHKKGENTINRRQLACLAILNGWHKILRNMADNSHEVILLDQGPVFLMAFLDMNGPRSLYESQFQNWWNKIYENWIHNLDMIVFLDTTNDKLIKRIRNRPTDLLSGMSDEEGEAFLSKYRGVYEQIITNFSSYDSRTSIVRIDSGELTPEEIVIKVVSEIRPETGNL